MLFVVARPPEQAVGPFGREIDAIRHELRDEDGDLGVEAFADMAGISQNLCSKYRRGVTAADRKTFKRWKAPGSKMSPYVGRLEAAAARFRDERDATREARRSTAGSATPRDRILARFEAIAQHVAWDIPWLERKLAALEADAVDRAGPLTDRAIQPADLGESGKGANVSERRVS